MWGLSSEKICKSIIIILKFKTNFVPTCIYNNDDTHAVMYNKVKEICQEITKVMIEINVILFQFWYQYCGEITKIK